MSGVPGSTMPRPYTYEEALDAGFIWPGQEQFNWSLDFNSPYGYQSPRSTGYSPVNTHGPGGNSPYYQTYQMPSYMTPATIPYGEPNVGASTPVQQPMPSGEPTGVIDGTPVNYNGMGPNGYQGRYGSYAQPGARPPSAPTGGGGSGVGSSSDGGGTPPASATSNEPSRYPNPVQFNGRTVYVDDLGHGDFGQGYDSLGHPAFGGGSGIPRRVLEQQFEIGKMMGTVDWTGSFVNWMKNGMPKAGQYTPQQMQELVSGRADPRDFNFGIGNQQPGGQPGGQPGATPTQPGQPTGGIGSNLPNWAVPGLGPWSPPMTSSPGGVQPGALPGGLQPLQDPNYWRGYNPDRLTRDYDPRDENFRNLPPDRQALVRQHRDAGYPQQAGSGQIPVSPIQNDGIMRGPGFGTSSGGNGYIPPSPISNDGTMSGPGFGTMSDSDMLMRNLGVDPAQIANDPQGWASYVQAARQRETQYPGSTALSNPQAGYPTNGYNGVAGGGYSLPYFTQPSFMENLTPEQMTNYFNYNSNVALPWADFMRGSYQNDRDFNRGVFMDDRNFGEDVFRDRRNFGEDARRYDQGFKEDVRRYDQGFGEDVFRDRRNFGEDTRRFDTTFNEGVRQFDTRFGEDQRQFNETLDWQKVADAMRTFGARQMPNVRRMSFR